MHDPLGRLPRLALIAVAVATALALPSAAQAHGLTTVAVDYRVRVLSAGHSGIQASATDGGRKLELDVRPDLTVVVLGYAGEPFLRFSPAGVEAAAQSPTAAGVGAVKAEPGRKAAWVLLTRSHSYGWPDNRPLPAPGAHGRAHWSISALAAGERIAIGGVSWREKRPALWPWIVIGAAVLLGAGALLREGSRFRWAGLLLALVAGVAAMANLTGIALSDTGSEASRWLQVALVTAIVLGGTALALRRTGVAQVAVGAIAVLAALECLSQLGMLRHAVVLSALPADLARTLVAVGLATGLAAAISTFVNPEPTRKDEK